MSELDDLEEIVDQQRYGTSNGVRLLTRKVRASFSAARDRGGLRNRSLEKQQARSSDRRHVDIDLAGKANQE